MGLRHLLRHIFFLNLMKVVFELRHDKQDKAGTTLPYYFYRFVAIS